MLLAALETIRLSLWQNRAMRCERCDSFNVEGTRICTSCGAVLGPTATGGGSATPRKDGSLDSIIPVKNPPALIAYYLGLFSLLPLLGLPLGIAAVVLGIIGLRKLRQTPQAKGIVHAWVGIGCGGACTLLWLVVLGFIIVAAVQGH